MWSRYFTLILPTILCHWHYNPYNLCWGWDRLSHSSPVTYLLSHISVFFDSRIHNCMHHWTLFIIWIRLYYRYFHSISQKFIVISGKLEQQQRMGKGPPWKTPSDPFWFLPFVPGLGLISFLNFLSHGDVIASSDTLLQASEANLVVGPTWLLRFPRCNYSFPLSRFFGFPSNQSFGVFLTC